MLRTCSHSRKSLVRTVVWLVPESPNDPPHALCSTYSCESRTMLARECGWSRAQVWPTKLPQPQWLRQVLPIVAPGSRRDSVSTSCDCANYNKESKGMVPHFRCEPSKLQLCTRPCSKHMTLHDPTFRIIALEAACSASQRTSEVI